jgi:uncharacterized protein involved in exopolysaccharide biosynthesis
VFVRPGIDQLKDIAEHAYEVLYRRRRVFAVVSAGLAFLLSLILLLQTPTYEASSLVLVKFGRELVYQSEVGKEQTVLTARDKATMINSEVAILHSRPVLEKVAETVGLPALYPDLGEAAAEVDAAPSDEKAQTLKLLHSQAAERLGESISTQALPDADVLSITFQHPDPITAETTIRELLDRFVEAHLEAYGTPAIAPFLERRVSEYEARLDASEKKLLEFETQHAAFALESPQTTLMQWRDETLKELTEVDNRIAAIRARHAEDAAAAEARNTLMNLQLEAEQLKGALRKDAVERIAVVQRFIASRKAEGEREVSASEQKKQALLAKLERTELELKEFPTLSAEYRSLRRERDADEEQYALYRRRLRDARLSSDMDREKIASISIIQPASTSPEPVWPPSKTASLPVVFVLSLVAGGLAAVLVDRYGGTGIPWLDEGSEPV